MKRWIIALGTAWLLALGGARADAAGRTLTFGIVPQQAASKLAMLWGPVLGYLSGKTGFELVFKTAPNIPEFERRVRAGEYDLAYMNPYHFTVFNRAPGYRAMARQAGARIKGIIVVRRDDTVRDLAGLAGTELAFPAPAAFAATLLPQAELRQQGFRSRHDMSLRTTPFTVVSRRDCSRPAAASNAPSRMSLPRCASSCASFGIPRVIRLTPSLHTRHSTKKPF